MDHISGTAHIRTAPPFAHVLVSGELDVATTPMLSVTLGDAVASGCRSFRVDLGEVAFCDASTVGVLVGLDRRMRATGGSLSIVAASACVRRVLSLVDLAWLLEPHGLAHEPTATLEPA